MSSIAGISGISALLQTTSTLYGGDSHRARSASTEADKAYLRESIRPLAARLLQERRTEKTWRIGPLTVRYEAVEGSGQASKDAAHELALIAESFKARLSGNPSQSGSGDVLPAIAALEKDTTEANVQAAGSAGAVADFGFVPETAEKAGAEPVAFPKVTTEDPAGKRTSDIGIGIWNSSVAATVTRTIIAARPGDSFFCFGQSEAGLDDTKLSQNLAKKTMQAIRAYMESSINVTTCARCMTPVAA